MIKANYIRIISVTLMIGTQATPREVETAIEVHNPSCMLQTEDVWDYINFLFITSFIS